MEREIETVMSSGSENPDGGKGAVENRKRGEGGIGLCVCMRGERKRKRRGRN